MVARRVVGAGSVVVALSLGSVVSLSWTPSAAVAAAARTAAVQPTLELLEDRVALAHGELRFDPPPLGIRPKQRTASVLTTARSAAGKETVAVRPRLLFGLFSASSPARKGPGGSTVPVFDRRPVWIVRWSKVRARRSSGVVERRHPPSTRSAPTTVDPVVVVDIVVVIDDRDGKQLLRSEYATERVVGLDVPAATLAPASTIAVLELGPTSSAVNR